MIIEIMRRVKTANLKLVVQKVVKVDQYIVM